MGRRKPVRRGHAVRATARALARGFEVSGGKLQRGSGGAGWLEAPTPGGGLPRQLRCVHVSLIIHACVAIASHVLTPSWLAFLTPYGLVVGSCVLLAGAAGAPLAGWRSRVAAILADDWRLPFMVVLVWVTLAQGHGMDLMAIATSSAHGTPAATFGRHAWVGAAGVQGLCSVILEYNLANMRGNGSSTGTKAAAGVAAGASGSTNKRGKGRRGKQARDAAANGEGGAGRAGSPTSGSGSEPVDPDSRRQSTDGGRSRTASQGGTGAVAPSGGPASSPVERTAKPGGGGGGRDGMATATADTSHEIYGPRRPLLLIITDMAAFAHGITWFLVTANTRTISLPYVLWMAVVALVAEALYSNTLVRLPALRYHGVMWTAAVGCLTLYGWSSDWQYPELPLLNRQWDA